MTVDKAFFSLITAYLKLVKKDVVKSEIRKDGIMIGDCIFTLDAANGLIICGRISNEVYKEDALSTVYTTIQSDIATQRGQYNILTDTEYKLLMLNGVYTETVNTILRYVKDAPGGILNFVFGSNTYSVAALEDLNCVCIRIFTETHEIVTVVASGHTPWIVTGEQHDSTVALGTLQKVHDLLCVADQINVVLHREG